MVNIKYTETEEKTCSANGKQTGWPEMTTTAKKKRGTKCQRMVTTSPGIANKWMKNGLGIFHFHRTIKVMEILWSGKKTEMKNEKQNKENASISHSAQQIIWNIKIIIIVCVFWEKINSNELCVSSVCFFNRKIRMTRDYNFFLLLFEIQLYGDWAPHKTDFTVENAI